MKKTELFTNNFLITNSNNIIKWSTVGFGIVFGSYLILLSIFNRDLKYPKEHPLLFTLETLLFSFTGSSLVFLMAHGRGVLSLKTLVSFLIDSLKFGILHILLQFSGFYSYTLNYSLLTIS